LSLTDMSVSTHIFAVSMSWDKNEIVIAIISFIKEEKKETKNFAKQFRKSFYRYWYHIFQLLLPANMSHEKEWQENWKIRFHSYSTQLHKKCHFKLNKRCYGCIKVVLLTTTMNLVSCGMNYLKTLSSLTIKDERWNEKKTFL
jgi:hypothetical protein